jgi:hypothetical protein
MAALLCGIVAVAQTPDKSPTDEKETSLETTASLFRVAGPEDETKPGLKIELESPAEFDEELLAAKLEPIPPVTPPLSLYECGLLMQEAIVTLEHGKPPLSDAGRRVYVDRIAHSVISYVDLVDRSYPTLPYYTWYLIAAEKAPPGDWDTMILRPRSPMLNITALSLRVRHGDVEIRRIVAIDKDKTRWEFNKKIHIISDQTRREVCFLPLPTHLVELQIECHRVDLSRPNRPRLYVHAGQSKVPEWAKQAIFKMQLACDTLRHKKFGQAAAHLREAYTLLEQFQKERER